MVNLPEKLDPAATENEARATWAAQRLPPASGFVGPADGPVVHQFEGAFAPQESGMLAVQRAIAADVDARAMILMGRRATGILRREESGPSTATPRLGPLLGTLGVWVGGTEGRTWDSEPRRSEVQRAVGRLAHMGALAVRDVSLRICPACALARSPERLVYQEEEGATLIVRFPFASGDRPVSALVWTDAAWRLLGASVLMVHPDLPYVIARYRRRDVDELVFTSKSSLDRIRRWLPGAEFEVLEEHPGSHWQGQAYVHPLRHEFPLGGSLEPPAGTIVPVADVSDSGTGVVPLVPGHGGTDTQIADRLGVPGWPLVTPKGRFDVLLVHKYAGLELDSATEFAERDLAEEGAIFARLHVRRGVPHCARCGTPLIWAPGRAWCLEPSRLPPEKVAIYRSLLPNDRPIERLEAVPWPVSEPARSEDPLAITLLECTSCDRLEATGHESERCVCGGRRRPVRRRLLAAFDAAVSAWSAVDPFPSSDSVRLYVNERRRAPALVHHIAAMSGVEGTPGEVRLGVLPTVPEVDFPKLLAARGADAVRSALVRAQASEGATATFEERCLQEARRLDAFWRTVRAILGPIDGTSLGAYHQPIAGFIGELEPEDRALHARFERLRIQCLVDFDRSAPGLVHRRLFQFLENDLAVYRRWVAPRLRLDGTPPSKRSAARTLVHVIDGATLLLGPIAPFLAEAVHRALRRGRVSLFDEAALGVDRTLLDDNRAHAWDRWVALARALDPHRRDRGLPADAPLPLVVLAVDSESAGDEWRAEAPTVARLVRAGKVEVGSPSAPWSGRRRELRPREAEIQRVYPSHATQIIHLLRRMPERKAADLASPQGFSMIVNGQPTQILFSMVEWVETLPDRVVPVGWPGGELYVELPKDRPAAGVPPPPLSPDAFRLVDRVRHRLRGRAEPGLDVVVVAASGPLGAELTSVADPIARHLGLKEFRVVASDAELPRVGRGFGRTKAGMRWSFHLTGAAPPSRAVKLHPPRTRGARVRPAFAPGALVPPVTDYADPEIVTREAAIRELGQQLDDVLGAPLLGPAKVAIAWDAGLRDLDAFRNAPWINLAALPGFGTSVASVLVTKFGGTIPELPPRMSREAEGDNGADGSLPATVDPTQWLEPAGRRARSVPSGPPAPISTTPALDTVKPEPISRTEDLSAPEEPSAPSPSEVSSPAATGSEPGPPVGESEESPDSPGVEPLSAEALPPVESPTEPTSPPSGEGPESGGASDMTLVDESAPAVPADAPEPELPTEFPADSEPSRGPSDLPEPPSVDSPPAEPPPTVEMSESDRPELSGSPPDEPPEEGAQRLPEVPPEPQNGGATAAVETEPELPTEEPSGEHEAGPEGAVNDAPSAPVEGMVTSAASPNESPELPDHSAELGDRVPAQPEEVTGTPSEVVSEAPIDEPPPSTTAPPESEPSAAPDESTATREVAPAAPTPEAADALVPEQEVAAEPGDAIPPPSPVEVPAVPPAPEAPGDSPTEAVPVSPDTAPVVPETLPLEEPTAPPAPSAPTPAEPESPPTEGPAPPMYAPGDVVPATLAPPTPPPTPPASGIDLAVGSSYIPALERFLEATAAGHQGLCIVRDSPERVRAYIGSRPVELRWLTNIGRGPTLKPNDLDGLAAFLAHTVSAGQVTVVFLEGVEYLVRIHGLEKVVERLIEVDRTARVHSARVWVPLNPKLLTGPELDRFVQALGGPAPAA